MLSLLHYLVLSGMLLTIGVVGLILNRRNMIAILMSIELILLAANTNFVAFSSFAQDLRAQVFVFFVLTVAAAESAIGLAILVTLSRSAKTTDMKLFNRLKG